MIHFTTGGNFLGMYQAYTPTQVRVVLQDIAQQAYVVNQQQYQTGMVMAIQQIASAPSS